MRTRGRAVTGDALERLRDAQNRHDLDAFVDCFDSSYRSEQPVHPDRAFTGREQVRRNWAAVFDGVPDFRAELLRSAEAGDIQWAEWHWHGTRTDGTQLEMRGVTIFGIDHDRILWGRLYLEDVDRSGGTIDQAVRRMTTAAELNGGRGDRAQVSATACLKALEVCFAARMTALTIQDVSRRSGLSEPALRYYEGGRTPDGLKSA